jgi:hypothetical protein
MDYNFWVPIAVPTVLSFFNLYLTHRQVRFSEAQPGVAPLPKFGISVKRYWPILVMTLMMLAVWIPFLTWRSQATDLARVIEEKRQQSITINAINEELNKIRQQGPLRAGKQRVLVSVPEPNDGIRVVDQKAIPTGNPNLKYGLEITVEAEKEIEPLGLILQFDEVIDKSSFAVFPNHKYVKASDPKQVTIPTLSPDMAVIRWQSPAWKPHEPIVFHVFSENEIKFKRIIRNIPGQ